MYRYEPPPPVIGQIYVSKEVDMYAPMKNIPLNRFCACVGNFLLRTPLPSVQSMRKCG